METQPTNGPGSAKLLIKGLIICGLILLLLIPTFFVNTLVKEREERQQEAFAEVSSKWAGKQNVTGAVLVVPYMDSPGIKKLAYILPDSITMDADAKPEERHRGIYQVMLYSSVIRFTGKFSPVPLLQLKLNSSDVFWNEAYICFGLTDPTGMREDVKLKWNDTTIGTNIPSVDNAIVQNGVAVAVPVSEGMSYHFSAELNINGSRQLLFTPLGKRAIVKLSSDWPDPSFTGSQLPEHRITNNGFVATWKNPSQTRAFPNAWKDNAYNLRNANPFGADLFIAVDDYQKTRRSVKYAILCIVLTFAGFFLIETVNRKSAHPFQYALVGLALILFYTLLLSISEYTGFNTAYIIASVATVGLIGWFVKGILQSAKLTSILGVILVLMYGYIFTILQLQDYSLLLGSIGLFITLAVVMHFSKKIQW